jgi:hypothetical protein
LAKNCARVLALGAPLLVRALNPGVEEEFTADVAAEVQLVRTCCEEQLRTLAALLAHAEKGRSEDSAERVLAFTSAYADALAPKLKEANTVDELLDALEPNSDMALDVLAKLHKQDKWTGSAGTTATPAATTPAANQQQQQQQRPQQQAGGPSRRGNRGGKRWPSAHQGGPSTAAYPPAGYAPYTTHPQAGGYYSGHNSYGAAGYNAPAGHRRGECVFSGLGTLSLLGKDYETVGKTGTV